MFGMVRSWRGGVSLGSLLVTVVGLGFAMVAAPAAAQAQRPADSDSLRQEVARLRAQLDSLLRVVARMDSTRALSSAPADSPAPAADPLAAIRAAAAAASGTGAGASGPPPAAAEPTEFVDRGSSLQALNPEISVTGDLLALVSGDLPREDNIIAREFEISLQSNLDPYSRAKIFIGRHVSGGELTPFHRDDHDHDHEEGEFEVEEGYVQWLNLPLGLGLTVGKFRHRFGQLNRWHSHSLPGHQLPIPYQAFFGDHGLAQTGASLHWLAPVYGGGGTYEFWLEMARSGNDVLFGESRKPSLLGHLNAFYELSPSTYFEIGLTGMTGPSALDSGGRATRLMGTDFTLSWRPPARSLYREAVLRGGAILGKIDTPTTLGSPESAFGAFLIGEYKLGRRWTIGSRYEYTQDPLDPTQHAWLFAPTLTWWQSEYVRIRAEFDNLRRPEGILRQFVIQTTFSMGPHKHDNY